METANVIAAVSAAVAVIGLFLAVLQFIDTRRRTRSDRERLAQHQERLRTAVTAAELAGQSADYIVQRSKDEDVTVTELQSVARVLRGSLGLLARQLEDESVQVPIPEQRKSFQSFREGRGGPISVSDREKDVGVRSDH